MNPYKVVILESVFNNVNAPPKVDEQLYAYKSEPLKLTYFKYIAKIDAVYEEFNRSAKPISWNEWYARYRADE